jgi:hypothetical protein
MVQRRDVLRGSLLAAGGLAGAAIGAPGTGPEALADVDPLMLMIRLRGRAFGELWMWIQGDVFGREPDEVLRPLVGFCSVLRMRYQPDSEDSCFFEQRESCHFYDVATGEVLVEFANPYTGKTNIAVPYVSPRFRFRMDSRGVYSGAGFDVLQGKLPRGIETDGVDVWTTESRANEYPTGLRQKEFPEAFASEVRRSRDIVTYRACIADVVNPDIDIVASKISFLADLPWLQWMLMGKTPGHAFWFGQGSKGADTQAIPDAVTARVNSVHPGFLEQPWELDGEPYGTLQQMRALRKAGRI